jgi:predicted nucleic acid-binding Zn ribbon protein
VEPIQSFLHTLVAGLVKPAPHSPEKVQCAWRLAVGPALARVTRVSGGAAGVIDVQVDDPHWREELERSRDIIVKRLREALGVEAARVMRLHGPRHTKRRGTRRAPSAETPSAPDA